MPQREIIIYFPNNFEGEARTSRRPGCGALSLKLAVRSTLKEPVSVGLNAPPCTVATSDPWPRQPSQLATWSLKAASGAPAEIRLPETVPLEIFSQSGESISSVFHHSFSESCCGFRNPPNPVQTQTPCFPANVFLGSMGIVVSPWLCSSLETR